MGVSERILSALVAHMSVFFLFTHFAVMGHSLVLHGPLGLHLHPRSSGG